MSFKQWFSSTFDLKTHSTIMIWESVGIAVSFLLIWQSLFIVVPLGGIFLTLMWINWRGEDVPGFKIYAVPMIIASYVLVIIVTTVFYWGECSILNGLGLSLNECQYPVQGFGRGVAILLSVGIFLGIPILLYLLHKARKMPRAIGNPCGISQRIIQKGDRCFWLPTFPCDPQDPLSKYSGACVLRDEFEKWELREELVRKIRETREQALSDSKSLKACPILFHDDTYLIIKARGSKQIEIIFWQHLFALDIPQGEWKNFYNQMLSLVDEIALDPNAIKEQEEKVKISGNAWGAGDCIELSLQEWKHLLDALRAAHEALRTRWSCPCNGAK